MDFTLFYYQFFLASIFRDNQTGALLLNPLLTEYKYIYIVMFFSLYKKQNLTLLNKTIETTKNKKL